VTLPGRFLPSDVGRLTARWWRFPRHLRAVESQAMRLVDDPEYNRAVVSLAVRHGKSSYCSWAFPVWYLLTHPNRKIILASYDKKHANEWAVKVRNTIAAYGRRLTGVGLGDVQTQEYFTLAPPHTGELRTTSPGSGVAGKGAHLIIPDDLIKDAKEAANPSRRHALTTWVNSELLTRLEPGGKVLAVLSRRHVDDQVGRWLAQNPELEPSERWHELRLPALALEDDPLGRAPGEALWPERFSVERLLKIKRRYELDGQSWLFDSLYQQDPRGDSTLIEWPEAYFDGIGYDELPAFTPRLRVLALDPSKGARDRTGDYSAWSDVTLAPDASLWVYPHLKLMPTESVEDYTVELLSRRRYDAVIGECNNFQETVIDNVVKKCRAKGVPCPMHKKTNLEDKKVRIRLGVGPLLAQHRVRICAQSPSYRLALAQMREFPTGAHEDFPDSLNLAVDLIEYLLTGRR
jgi:predicted phage terminase large subunit-like protein